MPKVFNVTKTDFVQNNRKIKRNIIIIIILFKLKGTGGSKIWVGKLPSLEPTKVGH